MFANGFEDFIDGVKQCPSKELHSGEINHGSFNGGALIE